jgi:hypothetical protein
LSQAIQLRSRNCPATTGNTVTGPLQCRASRERLTTTAPTPNRTSPMLEISHTP